MLLGDLADFEIGQPFCVSFGYRRATAAAKGQLGA
jgi:hypothetical protein